MKKVTTSIIHETRKTLSDGTHPVKLRVTYDRKQKYYTLNIASDKSGLTVQEWKKVNESTKGKYKQIRLDLNEKEQEASIIINDMAVFSFAEFETLFFKKQNKVDLFDALNEKAGELKKAEKLRTAELYGYTLKSLKEYTRTDKLLFSQITPDWLKNYEQWMRAKKNNSSTTISMYLRAVRAMFNQVGISGDAYPFGAKKYEMPQGRNIKRALSLDKIKLIYLYDAPPASFRELYRDYWILSYLCNGANITDLAMLQYKNIDTEIITFKRAKTSHHRGSKTAIVPLTNEIAKIIDKYKQPYKSPDTYLLPILHEGMNAKQRLTAIRNTVRGINKHIKVIAKNIGIEVNVTTYTARHSFATVLKRSGASIEYISEALIHNNIKTTENYLADFELDKKREMAELLTKWNDG